MAVQYEGILKQVDENGNEVELYPISKNGGIQIVEAESTDGVAYTAVAKGISEFVVGMKITIVPARVSASLTPTLNLNGLGAKYIRMRGTYNTATCVNPPVETWLNEGKPVTLTWEGTQWEVDYQRPAAASIAGTVAIENGGTGASTAMGALKNLGITGYITPQMFGAVGDGETDDYNAIQQAIDTVNENGGGTIYFPNGEYLISKELIFGNAMSIVGESTDKAIIRAATSLTSSTGNIVSFYNEAEHCFDISIRNITIDGNGISKHILCLYSAYDHSVIENVRILGVGAYTDGIRITTNPDLVNIDKISQGLYVVNTIVYMDKADCTGNALYADCLQESVFIGVKAFSQLEYPETIATKSIGFHLVDCRGLTFKNVSCGNIDNTIYPVYVRTASRVSNGLFFEDMTFESSANFLKCEGSETYPVTSLILQNVRDEGCGSSTPTVSLNYTNKSIVIIPIGTITDTNGNGNETYISGMIRVNINRGFDFYDYAYSTAPVLHLAYPWSSLHTSLQLLLNNGSGAVEKTVVVGEADSGGTGYRILRVLN